MAQDHTGSTTKRLVDETKKKREDKARQSLAATALAACVAGFGYWGFLIWPGQYDLLTALQFAGSSERFQSRLVDLKLVTSLSEARTALFWSMGFTMVWGAVGWALLHYFWQHAWKAGKGRESAAKGPFLGLVLGVGAAVIGLAEKVLTLFAVQESTTGDLQLADSWWSILPKLVLLLAWVKWILAGVLILLGVAMLVSTATAGIRPKRPTVATGGAPTDLPPELDPTAPVDGVGISCSGGGLRSAAFMLGALGRLEIDPTWAQTTHGLGLLGDAKYLSSVSGGGYAAGAWRIAAGTEGLPSRPIIGIPSSLDPSADVGSSDEDMPPAKQAPTNLIEFVNERRVYLANGPGGLLRAVVELVGKMAFHFALLLTFVVVLAWPLGRLIASWALTGEGVQSDTMETGLDPTLESVQLLPLKVLAAGAGLLSVGRLFMDTSATRKRLDVATYSLLGLAASLWVLMVALPHLLDWTIRVLPEGGGERFAVAGVYGVLLTALWQASKTKVQAAARYLGGVVLAAGLLFFALFVMGHAADEDEWFSEPKRWLVLFVVLVVAFVRLNPDRWSLHGFYRTRLAGTFAAKIDDGKLVPHDDEPALYKYAGVPGPMPIICCAVARNSADQTGIPALSMTLDPDGVTVHGWKGKRKNAKRDTRRMSHADFAMGLPQNKHGRGIHTLMGAAAISGAAVAPSMGGKSLKGTDALLAAFNARLGSWVPNPNPKSAGYPRSTTPRLVNMFKEITKTYDEEDPNVYATDGGHWENLGLVELIRRRCAVIIAIDASADLPGTYKVLRDAIRLAKLECQATIKISDASWNDLDMSAEQLTTRAYARGVITYADGAKADLLFVKAVVSEESPLQIQRYSANDPKFPNYSTANQLLGAEALGHLIDLGHFSMDQALKANHGLVAKALKS